MIHVTLGNKEPGGDGGSLACNQSCYQVSVYGSRPGICNAAVALTASTVINVCSVWERI